MQRRLSPNAEPLPDHRRLADTTIKLSDLKNLEVGDLILTEKPATAPLTLEIEGKRKFIGQLGQYKGNRVFRVDRPLSPKDRV